MAAAEETLHETAAQASKPKAKPAKPILNRALDFLSSVSFGITILILLVALSFLGMIIVQQNVSGFDIYYTSLTPAEKMVFGWLGFFDIYYSWYFKLLLLILSLNIILASIDRFPSAWSYIVKPKLDASRQWLLGRRQNTVLNFEAESEQELAEKIKSVFNANGLKAQITQKKDRLYVFGESGKWNRLGAYVVHVFLLTLFLGHFVALETGFDADVQFTPGQITNEIQILQFNLDKQERYAAALPFTITCTDIQQKLINPSGDIEITNTLDWRTQIKITDPKYGETTADVSLNKPFSYRGYRFFQASAITVGAARSMKIEMTPVGGGEPIVFDIMREGTHTLPDGTFVEYENFSPDFAMQGGQIEARSADYNNPAAVLNVTPPNAKDEDKRTRIFAFFNKLPDNAPVGAPKLGYKWRLVEYEKSPTAHVLSIKYDPYSAAFIAWYIGGFGLLGALGFVFFMSHRRTWALIEPVAGENKYEVVLGGEANRNFQAFEDKFNNITNQLLGAEAEVGTTESEK